jgi:gliding motility-associated-like protein
MLFVFSVRGYTQYTQTICSGSPLTFHNPSAPYPATQYSWSAPTVSGSVTGASAGANQIEISGTLTNNGTTPATVSYTVIDGTFSGTYNFTLTVTVDPLPVLTSPVTTTSMCSGGTFSYTATSGVAGTSFSWDRPAVTGISPGTTNASNASISEALTNSTSSQRTATYTFTLSAGSCTNTESISVNVNPTPTLTSSLTPADVCSGSVVSYTPLSAQSPVTFSWSRAVVAGITNGAGTGTGNISETLTNNTAASVAADYAYTLTHTSTGCTNTQTVTINIKPTPTLTSGTSFSHCSGTAFTYTPSSSLASTSYNWNRATVPNINPGGSFGTGNINETLTNTSGSAATTVYSYSLTAGGCTTNNQDVTVTVNPLPTLSSTLTAGSVCSGNPFHYTPTSAQSPSVTFDWSRATVAGISNTAATGTYDPGETLVNTTNAAVPVLYEYTLTNTSSTCTNLQVVTVNVNPIPTISNRAITICNHQGFTDIPPTAPIGTTYTWTTPTVTTGTITNTLNAQPVAQPVVSETILHNGTASNAEVEYVITPSLGACSGPSYTLTVTVGFGALPTIDLASSLTPPAICSNTQFSYSPTSNTTPHTFDFQRLAVAGISNPGSTGTNITSINEALVNTTNAPVTTFYYVTVNSGGCSNSFTVNVVVNPGTQLSSTLAPADVCSNTAFSYVPTSATATTFNWQRPTVAGISNAIASGSGNINETLINTTTAPVSVNYNFVLLTSATPACTFSQTVTVVVSPTPTLTSAASIPAICSGTAATYTASSATGGTLFSWTRAVAANINEPASAGFNPINEVLTNTSLTAGTASYIISLTAAGCTNQQTVTVAVNPVPAVTNQATTICSGNSFTITPAGGISGTQYTWAAPISTPLGVVTGGLSGTLQSNISGTLSNGSTAAGVASYTVSPVANGCTGAGFAVDITVNPRPSIGNVTIPAVCSGTAFLYTPSSIPSGTIYDWGIPVYTPAALSGGSAQVAQASITQTLTNSSLLQAFADYTVTPSFAGCAGSSFQLSVPVNPVPQVGAQVTAVCSGNTFSITPSGTPSGTMYTWGTPVSTPLGSVAGVSANAAPVSAISQLVSTSSVVPVQTTYTVVPVTGTCGGTAFTATVTVNPATSLSSTLTPADICSNTAFSYTPTSGTPSNNVFNWTRAVVTGISNSPGAGAGNPNETLVNTTGAPVAVTYTYALSTSAGCTNTQNVTVTVNPTPVLANNPSTTSICSGSVFNYTPAANTGGGTTFNWVRNAVTGVSNPSASGSNNPAETLLNTSINIIPVTYGYTLSAYGCSHSEDVLVNVNPLPVMGAQARTICSGTAFLVDNTGLPSGTAFSWPNPTSVPVSVVTGGSAGTLQASVSQVLTNITTTSGNLNYTATPIANGCPGGTFSITVTVKPVPNASDATLAAVCSGNAFSYTPASMPPGTQYSWSVPSVTGTLTGGSAQSLQPAISQTLSSSNNVANTAVYDVSPSANGCTGNVFHVTVPVNPVPVVNDQSVSICSGTTFTVTPTNVPTGTTYTWGMPIYTPPGSVSGGAAELTPQLSVSQYLFHSNTVAVQAQYTVTPAAGACAGNTFKVTVGINPGTQMNISTLAPDICSKSIFSYAAGSNTPGTVFQWTRAAIAGISNPAGAGTDNPLEPLYNITSQAISVTYLYTLTTPAGCTRTETVKVQVNPTPELTSSLYPAAVCSGSIFHYTPSSTLGGTSYVWARNAVGHISNTAATGNGDPSEQLVNTSLAGVDVPYQYTLTASGCSNTQTVTVAVNPTPAVSNTTAITCSNTAFAVAPANVPAGTIYTWAAPAVSPLNAITGAVAQPTGQADISQLLLNHTVNIATVRYTVTATAGSCGSAPFLVDVSVKPVATVANQTLTAICSGTAFDFTPANVPSGTTYTWTNPIISPANGLTGGGPEAINRLSISQTLSSINNLVNTATYTVTPLTNGCTGTPFALAVRVNPTPSVANIRDTVCTGDPVSIAPSPVPANTAYTWGNPSYFPFGSLFGGTAQVSPAPSFSQTLINTTTTTALAVYTVRPVADNCTGNDFTVTVTVGAGLNTIPNQAASVCSGVAFDATPVNQPAGTGYTWAVPVVTPAGSLMGHSAASTRQASISQLLNNLTGADATAVYTVSAYNNGCTSNNFTATVTVMPVPRITVSGSQEICRYPSDTLSLSFTGQAPWGFTYTDDANVQHTLNGISNAPYKLAIPATQANTRTLSFLKVTHGGGCANLDDTVYFSQIIHSLPTGTLHSQRGIYICNNIPDTLFVTSPDSVGYQWRFNSVNIPGATDDSLVTNMGGRYNVMLTNRFGCNDTAAVQTSLIYIPQPVLRLMYDTYCINTLMNFTNITDTNLTGPTQWLWSFDNGTTAGTFHSSTTFTTGGDHHIQLKASQLYCPAVSTTLDTTVNIRFPIDGITMPSMWAYKGVSNPISARSLPGYRYRWNPPYGINRPDSANTFFNLQNTQQYVIDLISPAGCVTQDSLLVRVYEDKLVDILVPKSFTPNGDGINDILYPYLTGIKEFKYFKVYNRFNQLMFETTNYDVGWNGMKAGIAQPMAIYIWVAVGVATDGSMVEKKGQVLLLR